MLLVEGLQFAEVPLERAEVVVRFEDQGRFRFGGQPLRVCFVRYGADGQQWSVGIVCKNAKGAGVSGNSGVFPARV